MNAQQAQKNNDALLKNHMTPEEIAVCCVAGLSHADFLANKTKLEKHIKDANRR